MVPLYQILDITDAENLVIDFVKKQLADILCKQEVKDSYYFSRSCETCENFNQCRSQIKSGQELACLPNICHREKKIVDSIISGFPECPCAEKPLVALKNNALAILQQHHRKFPEAEKQYSLKRILGISWPDQTDFEGPFLDCFLKDHRVSISGHCYVPQSSHIGVMLSIISDSISGELVAFEIRTVQLCREQVTPLDRELKCRDSPSILRQLFGSICLLSVRCCDAFVCIKAASSILYSRKI